MFKNEKGVTLVELLIVIVILGIIAAISVPAVGNIVSNANKDALLADATNLQQQVNLYCTSEDDDICKVDSAEYETDQEYFRNGGTGGETGEYTLDEYLDLGDDVSYLVWYDTTSADEVWNVAIDDGEYYFAGDPSSASRDAVVDASDNSLIAGYDGTGGTDFPEFTPIS
jgi:type IV pilus assembly protein PilA